MPGSSRVLVTGGAGYIGSHVCKRIAAAGHQPIVFDNLVTGHEYLVRWGPFIRADLADPDAIRKALRDWRISAVLHLAASAYVGESITMPRQYFRNNAVCTLNLLDAMVDVGVRDLVFSSTCATYGDSGIVSITEDQLQEPVSPYGESKRFAERALHWYGDAYGIRWVVLRFFNAAGCDPEGEIGEHHDPETHLIPRAVQAALGVGPPLEIFGTDYPTPDGTAVRDYIHVQDLAIAHRNALAYLSEGNANTAVNVGASRGHSVLEVINAVERCAGRPVPYCVKPRRAGDPAKLVSNADKARELLGWNPAFSDLGTIVETACRWELTKNAWRLSGTGAATRPCA